MRALGKTINKNDNNLCKQAPIAGKGTCNGEDLLAEYINMCKELNISFTSEGNHKKGEIKNALWREQQGHQDTSRRKKQSGNNTSDIKERKKLSQLNEPTKHKNMGQIQMQNNRANINKIACEDKKKDHTRLKEIVSI